MFHRKFPSAPTDSRKFSFYLPLARHIWCETNASTVSIHIMHIHTDLCSDLHSDMCPNLSTIVSLMAMDQNTLWPCQVRVRAKYIAKIKMKF